MTAVMTSIMLMFAAATGKLATVMTGALPTTGNGSTKTVTVFTPRGTIYDRNLLPMTNAQTRTVAVIEPTAAAVAAVSGQLGDNAAAALEKLRSGSPAAIEVPSEFECGDCLKYTVPLRYGEGRLASHVIGYVDALGAGVTGTEYAFDDVLGQNEPLKVTYRVDAVGRPLAGVAPEVSGSAEATAGVALTIDTQVQRLVESAAKDRLDKGAVIVMESATGRLLALASFPDYSPTAVGEALNDENAPLVNRALSLYNVGSVFKPAVAAAALKSGISADFTDTCSGFVDVSGKVFNCHLHSGHGTLNMEQALAQSCNCYFIALGRRTGGANILDMCTRLGFSRSYSLAQTLTAPAGTLPGLATLSSQPAALANLSFGQGELMLTPLHIATLVAAIANGGNLVTPSLVLGLTEGGQLKSEISPAKPRRVISGEIAGKLKQMMLYTVSSGTGRAAAPEAGRAGGKTATAETGWTVSGRTIKQSWFAGFYPESGEYTVVVIREDGVGGAADCAPVFKLIADGLAQLM